jgi:epoxyqueuosine reductase
MILQQLARQSLRELAESEGFACLGFVAASEAKDFPHLKAWLDHGYAGGMDYLANRIEAYRHPEGVLPGCKSLMILALPYSSHPRTTPAKFPIHSDPPLLPARVESGRGTIAAYAAGAIDYHECTHRALDRLTSKLDSMFPNCKSRGVVDTAPLLERHFAHRAGLGWVGKNTMLLNRQLGSYFFLASVLTQADLIAGNEAIPGDQLLSGSIPENDHCGKCRACLDACPTKAFVEPRVLDATRCISYWTIEHRGPVPLEIREQIGDWLFGCDVCQAVCPWNRKRSGEVIPSLRIDDWEEKTDCMFWLQLSSEQFRIRFRKTAFWRTRLEGMQRNAMIVAANTHCVDAIDLLEKFLLHDDPTLRNTAQWALGQLRLEQ